MTIKTKLLQELSTVNSKYNSKETLETIKKALEEQDPFTYQEWKRSEFDMNYLFKVKDGESTLQIPLVSLAVLFGNSVMVNHLVYQGADVNKKGNNGYTALHLAAMYDNKGMVEGLLKLGANPSVKNRDGKTPSELAHNGEIRHLLKEKEAINKASKIGTTSSIVAGVAVFLLTCSCIVGLQLALSVASMALASILSALLIGDLANLIAYSALKPSSKFCETTKEQCDLILLK